MQEQMCKSERENCQTKTPSGQRNQKTSQNSTFVHQGRSCNLDDTRYVSAVMKPEVLSVIRKEPAQHQYINVAILAYCSYSFGLKCKRKLLQIIC